MGLVGGLLGLSLRVCYSPAEDLSLIFAEPQVHQIEEMIQEKYILEIVKQIMRGRKSKDLQEDKISVKNEKKETRKDQEKDPLESDDQDQEYLPNIEGEVEDELDDEVDLDDEPPRAAVIEKLPIKKLNVKEFSCTICTKVMTSRTNARKHIKIHGIGLEPLEDRTCPHCCKVFDHATLCRKHVKRKCKMMMKAKCDQCDIIFEDGPQLKQHMKNCHDYAKYKCTYCDHVASTSQNKMTHEKRMHLNMDCKLCKKLFSSEEDKSEHTCGELERYQCDQCEKSYKAKGELRNHVMVVHEGLRYPCSFCPDVLSSVQALKRHEKSFHHSNPRDHVCDICSQAFTHKDTLKKHILTHDKILRSDPCPYCGKVLRNKDVLRQHIKALHEKNFSVVCEDCGQKFANKHRLDIHNEMTHLKGKTFVCQTCGKEFLGKRRLQNHMISKHPKGQIFVSCEYCGQEVGEKQLRSHIVEAHKSHAYKFQCSHCLKKFPVKGHIKRHMRVHTGARPYLCRGCGNYYVDLEAVKDHIRKSHNSDIGLAHYDISKDIDNPYV